MKRLSTVIMCLFAMMAASLSAKAQEVTINLFPGWNWISYPNAEMQDVNTALGDFVPVNGDIILSQYSSSTYVNGYWRGGVTHFMPGWGYMYYSNRTEVVSFVFGETAPQLTVTTAEPTDITATSAISGGSITSNDGSYVFVLEKGICWATHQNPTVMNDFHTENGNGINSFTAEMTDLSLNTVYYLRAYAVTESGTTYGEEMSFTTRDGIPMAITDSVTNIWSYSAILCGSITDNGGLDIIDRGVCWSTLQNPTVDDSHTTCGFGLGSFTCMIMGLSSNTTYYARAYASTINAIAYGEEMSFVTVEEEDIWVDLGLPSGNLWAICDVGATIPEDHGVRFAWGETNPKDVYNWSTYLYCNGTNNTLIKYCTDSNYGYNGFIDNIITLLPEDDAATANWGDGWRMPTIEEWMELYQNTSHTWTMQNGVYGRLFTGVNGNSVFLPASGSAGSGEYWSSSLANTPFDAYSFVFNSSNCHPLGPTRAGGHHVRAVRTTQPITTYSINAVTNPTEGGSVTGTGNYEENAICTLTALSNEGYTFSQWTENDEVVSNDAEYSFTVNSNRNLVANFISQSGAPIGAIDGLFTINAEGGQVRFSQGNLQYQASTNTWRFAESQWDYVGADNSNISSEYDGWIDLFGWGTSGYHNVYDNFNVNYQPYSTSSAIVHTECNYYGYGPSTNMYDPNLTGMSAEYDWGVHNAINNGGNQTGLWRTLSREEWQYVLFTRSASTVGNTSNARFAKATVNGVSGVILFPDVFSVPIYLPTPLQINNSSASFGVNSYSADGWTALENLGCAFMPVAGYRQGTSISDTGSLGYYWSSSYSGYRSALCVSIHNFQNYSNPLDMTTNYRYTGCSVRLVHDVE